MKRALVIGGSLGGLFAANLLADLGWEVDVYEKVMDDLAARGASHRRRRPARSRARATLSGPGARVRRLRRVAQHRRGKRAASGDARMARHELLVCAAAGRDDALLPGAGQGSIATRARLEL